MHRNACKKPKTSGATLYPRRFLGGNFFDFWSIKKKIGGYVSPILENNVLIFGVLGGDGGCTIKGKSVLGYKITPRAWMKVNRTH